MKCVSQARGGGQARGRGRGAEESGLPGGWEESSAQVQAALEIHTASCLDA